MRALAILLALWTTCAAAQDWGDLDGLLDRSLGDGRPLAAGGYWLPDNVDPAQARSALGVIYPVIVGAAGNFEIRAGIFRRTTTGFALSVPVSGLFGTRPRDAAFLSDRIEVTTTMPQPGEPRCCPTGTARWRIDPQTGAAARLD
ncbi:hypothetical protein SAMN04490244_103131 [Tranquillimonas rosea]|uniref:Uncharacterized protein n=1 Tax=Tranquillimonas rosea TaxID=641238 RepID=A0A1H9SC25_9RHOB|nr:hypothetical protein [Tranquillimonas rosea]SER82511.1 hypothetical protein SAMN04490244_103131 [Tranquillimonas rosea]